MRVPLAIKGLVVLAAAGSVTVLAAGCGSDDNAPASTAAGGSSTLAEGGEPVSLVPADFTTEITNPYWPMKPGSRWIYRETDEDTTRRIVVTVTDRTRRIANGVVARVVRDVVTEDGEPVEVTDDWYAQDPEGNIWYLGEDTAEYENGKVASREGSFETGVDGAQAGIAVPADPAVGLAYRQEYYAGQAEDTAKVLALDAQAMVPFGNFDSVLRTEDTNPLSDPPEVEHKFYAPDVGPVLAIAIAGGSGREELLSYTP
jgi:hypothetical protein